MDPVTAILFLVVVAIVVGAVWSVTSRRRDQRDGSPAPGQRRGEATNPPWTQP